ncbi:MAG TPA: hypothetical protein VH744_09750 [Terriglobales bacterium]
MLRATLAPSLTMSVSPASAEADPFLAAFQKTKGPTVTARWAPAPANVNIAVLASDGQPALVAASGNSLGAEQPVSFLSYGLLPLNRTPSQMDRLSVEIDTSRLELRSDAEDRVLTIRAEAQ